jgi:predicted phage terminase large subunit-like protein
LNPETVTVEQLSQLPEEQLRYLLWQARWVATARPNQILPAGDWTQAGFMAGRGFGKTRVGAEWLGAAAYEDPEALPSAVIAPTFGDARFVCFEGPAGLLSVIPPELVDNYNSADLILTLTNGASIRGFTAEKPARLRGPQHARIWADELAAWQYAQDTWDMAQMGLRLGQNPKVVWTTTPRPLDLVRQLTQPKEGRIIVRGSTYDNKANLAKSFFDELTVYEGTTIGRQELMGELLDPEEAGIIRRSWMPLWPADKPLPQFEWLIMSLDTAFTEATTDRKNGADFSACGVWGVFQHEGLGHVLLLDCWAEQYGLPDLIKRVKRELNVSYGDDQDTAIIKPMFGGSKPVTSGRKPDILLIEDKGSGISLRQMLEREGIEAYAYNPGRADKLSRLHMVSPMFARKRIWLPESKKLPGKPMTWVEPMLAQLCSFTGAGSTKNDDHVDQVTQAIRLCMDKGLLEVAKPKKIDPSDIPPPAKPVANPYAA